MNGLIRKAVASLSLSAAGVLTVAGCTQYRAHVDPCWPERYDYETRRNVYSYFDAQCANGHVFDQMLWNFDFERDDKGNPTDKLTAGGIERLKYIMRRRPMPDGHLYLQTANDLPASTDWNLYAEKRQEIDTQRIAAIQKYLGVVTAGRPTQVAWNVDVIDPAAVGLPAAAVGGAPSGAMNVTGFYPKLMTNFQGVFGTVTGFTTPVGGGGAGGGGAAGGGAGGTMGGAAQTGGAASAAPPAAGGTPGSN